MLHGADWFVQASGVSVSVNILAWRTCRTAGIAPPIGRSYVIITSVLQLLNTEQFKGKLIYLTL